MQKRFQFLDDDAPLGDPRPLAERLEAAGEADRSLGRGSAKPKQIENLRWHVLAAGAIDEAQVAASAFAATGIEYGLPLQLVPGVDLQLGGSATKREGQRLDLLVTAGLLTRDWPLGAARAGGAALVEYLRSRDDSDLFGLRALLGLSLPSRHHLGWHSSFPLNEDRIDTGPRAGLRQRILLRNELVWGHEFSDRFAAELHGGYLAGEEASPVFGLRLGFTTDRQFSILPSFESTLDGHYAAGVLLVFEFAGRKHAAIVTRYASEGVLDHSPVRLRSFAELLIDNR